MSVNTTLLTLALVLLWSVGFLTSASKSLFSLTVQFHDYSCDHIFPGSCGSDTYLASVPRMDTFPKWDFPCLLPHPLHELLQPPFTYSFLNKKVTKVNKYIYIHMYMYYLFIYLFKFTLDAPC